MQIVQTSRRHRDISDIEPSIPRPDPLSIGTYNCFDFLDHQAKLLKKNEKNENVVFEALRRNKYCFAKCIRRNMYAERLRAIVWNAVSVS